MDTTFKQQILALIPDGFSGEAQGIILATVLSNIEARISPLSEQVADAVIYFENEYPALSVCPHCGGEGCGCCDFNGFYDPGEVEPNGTN